MLRTIIERFLEKISVSNVNFYKGTCCWEWTGSKNRGGYGQIQLEGKKERVHRLSYILFIGKIPEKLELDHLCRNIVCCNPDHLEAVTHKENMRRGLTGVATGLQNSNKTHCPQGHEYSQENIYTAPDGHRQCRICRAAAKHRFNLRDKIPTE